MTFIVLDRNLGANTTILTAAPNVTLRNGLKKGVELALIRRQSTYNRLSTRLRWLSVIAMESGLVLHVLRLALVFLIFAIIWISAESIKRLLALSHRSAAALC